MSIGVIGGGVFGLTAALALRRRGQAVTVYDTRPVPHPDAASDDLSKAVRLDYGQDTFYTALMERALPGWRAWNRRYGEVFVESGVLVLAGRDEAAFEADSAAAMRARGHRIEPLDARALRARFPMWSTARHASGYYNPQGGFARASKTVAALARDAAEQGVAFAFGGPVSVERVAAEHPRVLVAAGAWTPQLLPELAPILTPTGQTILYLWPSDVAAWRGLPTFTADVSRTGWYGFPITVDGVIKLGHHGVGRVLDPGGPRPDAPDMEARARAFLAESLPGLATAPLARQRTCVYCDTFDGHFWIDRVAGRDGVFVAAGGSGHGFKFAPVLGELIADRVLGRENPALARFAARPVGAARKEQARASS